MFAPKVAPNDCPPAREGFRASLRTLIIHEACQTAGGVAPLARLLGVGPSTVERWLNSAEEAPPEVYQACIDIVLLHDPGAEGLSAPQAPVPPR